MILKSLDKGLQILCCLGAKSKIGPSEIARELKYGKSTVIRLLQTMEPLGFVRHDGDTGRYELGARVLELAHDFLQQQEGLISMAGDQIRTLWEKCGETVALYVREGDTRVCIYRLESPLPLRYSLSLGEVRPLSRGAAGRTFLAYMHSDELEDLIFRLKIEPDRAAWLRGELAEIRLSGVAFNHDERGTGRAAVASPILDWRSEAVAVLAISGPVQRLPPDRLREVAEPLANAARTISRRLVG